MTTQKMTRPGPTPTPAHRTRTRTSPRATPPSRSPRCEATSPARSLRRGPPARRPRGRVRRARVATRVGTRRSFAAPRPTSRCGGSKTRSSTTTPRPPRAIPASPPDAHLLSRVAGDARDARRGRDAPRRGGGAARGARGRRATAREAKRSRGIRVGGQGERADRGRGGAPSATRA